MVGGLGFRVFLGPLFRDQGGGCEGNDELLVGEIGLSEGLEVRAVGGGQRAAESELSDFPSDVLGDARALGQEGHELWGGVVFFQLGRAGDKNFSVLAEVVLVVILEGVMADSIVALEGEGEGFEFRMTAGTGGVGEPLEGDGALGEAGLAGDRGGVDGGWRIVDGPAEDMVEDEEATGDHGSFIAADGEEAALGEEAAALRIF